MNSQVVLQALKNPNKYFTLQIIQKIIQYIDELQVKGRLIQFFWILVYIDIKRNKKVDMGAKKVTRQKKAKRKNRKWRE